MIREISHLLSSSIIIGGQVLGLDGEPEVEPEGGEEWLTPNVRSRFPVHGDILQIFAEYVLQNPWSTLPTALLERSVFPAQREDNYVNPPQPEDDDKEPNQPGNDERSLRKSALERFIEFPWLPCVTSEHPSSADEKIIDIKCFPVADLQHLAPDGLPNYDLSIPLNVTTPLISYFSAPKDDPSGATQVPCFLVRCKMNEKEDGKKKTKEEEDEPIFRISWTWHSLFVGWFRTRLRCETNNEPFFAWEQMKDYTHEVLQFSSSVHT
jgi:hypothetical protein